MRLVDVSLFTHCLQFFSQERSLSCLLGTVEERNDSYPIGYEQFTLQNYVLSELVYFGNHDSHVTVLSNAS